VSELLAGLEASVKARRAGGGSDSDGEKPARRHGEKGRGEGGTREKGGQKGRREEVTGDLAAVRRAMPIDDPGMGASITNSSTRFGNPVARPITEPTAS
jgi:hypothetical protein